MKIIPTSVPTSQKPTTTSKPDITTSGLMSDTSAGTSIDPTSATTPGRASNLGIISDIIPWSNSDNTLGVVAGVLTSVALAAVVVVQCVIFAMAKREQDSSERSVQSNPRKAQEQRRTADLTSSQQPMVNTGASVSHANNYMSLVKSEYIDGSAMSEDNDGRPEYQELGAAEVPWTPFDDEYSYAYYTAADEVNPDGGSEEKDTKQNSDACEMQHVYTIDVHNT
ncbi:uncharacterized protein LOC106175282 [Lingula anatina]|uniref:Uncharacterized protein LOC106175282 n=1 Tax=Lingula anatina TaxID=7574 RepID=A0A1S3JQL4_LINAN|nr:uncharacterized protein LOC106175282 [Lingula anatina]|eukprot:XP_013412650.1 uncharacterized protein LOC106175282 [Lingula anatina]